MNLALWKKAWGEVRITLPCFVMLMFGFQLLHSWVASQIDLRLIEHVLRGLPDFLQRVLPVSIEQLSSYTGRLAIGYDHPLVAIGSAFWAISRGSDAVSGPLNRGTLELVLAQPVRRIEVLASNAGFAIIGAALMAGACWLGTALSVTLIPKLQGIAGRQFGHCALNLFTYTFFLAGLATLISSADRYRSRTIGIAAALYVMAILLKLLGGMAESWQFASYGSFLTAYEPQRFVDPEFDPFSLALSHDVPLIVLGLLCYVAAAIIFTRRDLPAPL